MKFVWQKCQNMSEIYIYTKEAHLLMLIFTTHKCKQHRLLFFKVIFKFYLHRNRPRMDKSCGCGIQDGHTNHQTRYAWSFGRIQTS
jgi:hypothetical protein